MVTLRGASVKRYWDRLERLGEQLEKLDVVDE
jgi:hypothetical protein